MIENQALKISKRDRIKISNLKDFKKALKNENYNIKATDKEKFKEEIKKAFNINDDIFERLYKCLNEDIAYKVDNAEDFIDYIKKIMIFEDKHEIICEKLKSIEKLYINREEYEREKSTRDNVEHIIEVIEKTKENVSRKISLEELERLEVLEEELEDKYLFAKDIEFLKKMLLGNCKNVIETYNEKTKIKTLKMKIPKDIDYSYIKAKEGSVEYHQYLNNNIDRMNRLIKSIDKYIEHYKDDIFNINQSLALQDSINIALATFDNKEFKAISGKNDIEDYCKVIPIEKSRFKSRKVNKLGELGIGYNRVNDSEKKILEEIHKKIKKKILKDRGKLTLYTKWEPCPSCYFVISQFSEMYPNIKVEVKYNKKYGE